MQTGYSISTSEYNKLIAHADKTIKNLREEIKIYKAVIQQIQPQEGKQITKRILNHVNLESYSVSYIKRYDRYYLYIHRGQFNCEIGLADYQGSKVDIVYISKRLEDKEKELVKDLENQNRITEIVSKYNTALQYYKKCEEELRTLPGFYTFSRW